MSMWTYITGAIEVSVPGRTQAEIDYILQTVLDHLPRVTGSEGDMEIYINRHEGHCSSCSCDEYEMNTNNLVDMYGDKDQKRGWLRTQDCYTLALHGALRDRGVGKTTREFMKWLCRLSKRLMVGEVLVNIRGYDRSVLINDSESYREMYEDPSWSRRSREEVPEPAWWEHLMWKRFGDWALPLEHIVKYYDCPEADEEYEKRVR